MHFGRHICSRRQTMSGLVFYQVVSILSCLGSLMVVLTLVFFKSMRSKLFMQIIAFISLADIIANVEYTMTYRPSNNNWWCSLQGFLNLYGYPCGWLWTTVLMQFLHDLAVYKQVRMSMRSAFIFCWGLPLVTTLLYIAFIPEGTYERPSGSDTEQLCSYGGNNFEQGFVWHMISYYGLFVLCVAYMLYMYYHLRKIYHVKQIAMVADPNRETVVGGNEGGGAGVESAQSALQRVRLTTESLLLYPILMVIFWTPHIVGVLLKPHLSGSAVKDYAFVATNLKILCGFATASLFFWKSQAARTLWIRFLCNQRTPNNAADDDAGLQRGSLSSVGSSFRDSSFAEFSVDDMHESFVTASYGPESMAARGTSMRGTSMMRSTTGAAGGNASLFGHFSVPRGTGVGVNRAVTQTVNPMGTTGMSDVEL